MLWLERSDLAKSGGQFNLAMVLCTQIIQALVCTKKVVTKHVILDESLRLYGQAFKRACRTGTFSGKSLKEKGKTQPSDAGSDARSSVGKHAGMALRSSSREPQMQRAARSREDCPTAVGMADGKPDFGQADGKPGTTGRG